MKQQRIRRRLSVGGLLTFSGLLIFLVAFMCAGFDIEKISTLPPYEKQTYVTESVPETITIEGDINDIVFLPSEDGQVHLRYEANERETYQMREEQGLYIEKMSTYQWYEKLFQIDFHRLRLMVLVPTNYSGRIQINSVAGDLYVQDIAATSLSAVTGDGDIVCEGICTEESLQLQTQSGDIRATVRGNENEFEIQTKCDEISSHRAAQSGESGKSIQIETEDGTLSLAFQQ